MLTCALLVSVAVGIGFGLLPAVQCSGVEVFVALGGRGLTRTRRMAARRLEGGGVPTYCTPIAWAEVHAGIRPGEEPMTQELFEARGEVVIDAAIGRRAGAYLARYSRSHGVELADALVASAAATARLHLWTLNRTHYPMPDVRFYQP